MIPCIEDKCLKYPVCKSKTILDCTLILNYYKLLSPYSFQVWHTLHEHLPNLKTLVSHKKGITSSITYKKSMPKNEYSKKED